MRVQRRFIYRENMLVQGRKGSLIRIIRAFFVGTTIYKRMTFQFSIDVPSSQPLPALRLCRFCCFRKKLQTHKHTLLNAASFQKAFEEGTSSIPVFPSHQNFCATFLSRDLCFENYILQILSLYRNHGMIL